MLLSFIKIHSLILLHSGDVLMAICALGICLREFSCVLIVFSLCSHCVLVVSSFRFSHDVLMAICAHGILKVFSYCSHCVLSVLILFSFCSHGNLCMAILMVFTLCYRHVLTLCASLKCNYKSVPSTSAC